MRGTSTCTFTFLLFGTNKSCLAFVIKHTETAYIAERVWRSPLLASYAKGSLHLPEQGNINKMRDDGKYWCQSNQILNIRDYHN